MARPRIERFDWRPSIEEKMLAKHGLTSDEVEESFYHPDLKRSRTRGRLVLLSRTDAGRYIFVVYLLNDRVATIITARDMTQIERRRFQRK